MSNGIAVPASLRQSTLRPDQVVHLSRMMHQPNSTLNTYLARRRASVADTPSVRECEPMLYAAGHGRPVPGDMSVLRFSCHNARGHAYVDVVSSIERIPIQCILWDLPWDISSADVSEYFSDLYAGGDPNERTLEWVWTGGSKRLGTTAGENIHWLAVFWRVSLPPILDCMMPDDSPEWGDEVYL